MMLAVGGGAALGAALGSRFADREAARTPARPVAAPAFEWDVESASQQQATAPVVPADMATRPAVEAENASRPRRRLLGVAYAMALLMALGGVGLIGIGMASQREVPQPPPAPPEVAVQAPTQAPTPASDSVRVGAAAFAHEKFRQITPRRQQGVAPQQEVVAEEPPPLTMPRSRPVAVDIPSIDVHSVVRRLGLTDEGELETPSGRYYDDAAWYRHSPPPGSLGPSILLGHVDSAANGPSVFFRLGEVRAGDRVEVTRADGSVAVFVVDEVRRYAKKDFPTELVYGDIDHAGLRILTCGGPFDEVSGHYLDNIVVFASLVEK